MRYLLFLPLFVVFLSACSKSDKEMIKGEWTMSEMEKDGKLVMSADAKKQKELLDEAWKEQGPLMEQMGMTRDIFDQNMQTQFKAMSETIFIFTEKGKVDIKAKGKTSDSSDFTLNEEKKQITIKDKEKEEVYTYEFKDDLMTLTQKKDKLVFKRKA